MRLVSLCPSTTETLIDFGLADQLVGITRFCIHPREIVSALPKVGGTKTPDLDAIAAARPDLVLMNSEENRAEDHQALLERGLSVDVTCPKTVADVPALLRHFGALTGREEAAERRASELEAALASLIPAAKFRYAYLIWRDPWMTVNRDTYIADLLARAGGENVFAAEATRYPATTLNQIALRDADAVLLPDEPYPFSAKHLPQIEPYVGRARCFFVSGDDLCWHGVRSLRGMAAAEKLAREIAL